MLLIMRSSLLNAPLCVAPSSVPYMLLIKMSEDLEIPKIDVLIPTAYYFKVTQSKLTFCVCVCVRAC